MDNSLEANGREAERRIGDILHQLTDDVKTIAHDEIELARIELAKSAKMAAVDAAVVMLGGIVALIGLGLLSVSAVDALEPILSPLWLRLIIMAVVYLALGGAVAAAFARRLKRDVQPDLKPIAVHAERTAAAVKAGLRRNEEHHA